jgi:hypothetical protein
MKPYAIETSEKIVKAYKQCDIAVLKKVRYALCPMPYALCPMPYAHEYLIFLRKAIHLF